MPTDNQEKHNIPGRDIISAHSMPNRQSFCLSYLSRMTPTYDNILLDRTKIVRNTKHHYFNNGNNFEILDVNKWKK